MPHSTVSLLYISRTIYARITKFYSHNHADLPYICTGYDVNNYFHSEVTMKKPSKMPPQSEFLEKLIREDHQI